MKRHLVLALVLLLGCATGTRLVRKSTQIQYGDSLSRVESILGVPGDRQAEGDHEAWQYCRTGEYEDEFVIVWFFQGHVSRVNTHTLNELIASYTGSCSRGFRKIRWRDAPEPRQGS